MIAKPLLSFDSKRAAWLMGGFVFGIALLLQVVLCADYYLHSPFYSGLICDSKVYYKWAATILGGDWFGDEVFHQAPLYPYFIAMAWLVFGQHYLVIYAGQALMMALTALLVFLITRKLFNNYAGLAAGLLCAFYGTLNFYALKVLPDTLAVLLHVWLAYLLLKAVTPRQWFLAGCVCGLLIIGRPHALLLLPMVLVWTILAPSQAGAPRAGALSVLRPFVYFMLPVVFLVGLVAARNYTIEPDLVLVSCNGGENFAQGNNPKAGGIYCRLDGIAPDIEHQKADVKTVAEARLRRPLTRARVSSYWQAQGLSFIRGNFAKYLRLEATKFKRIFSGTEYANAYFLWFERAEFTKTLAIPAAPFYLILPLAVVGAVLCAGEWRKYGLLYIMIALSVLNMLIFYVDERYRLPLIPFLIVLGVGGVCRLPSIIGTKPRLRWGSIGLGALVPAAVAIACYLYRTEPARLAVTHSLYNNLGEVYYEKGEYRQAVNIFHKSCQMASNNWEAELGIGKALFALGHKDMAARLYREAFPNLDADLQTSCLRDHDFDGLREYMQLQGGL